MPKSRRSAPKKSSKSRKRPAAQEEGWFTIRRILDERVVKGHVEYLVDWDDNVVAGEAYTPTWSREVTDTAKEEWEGRKTERADQETQSNTPLVEASDNSQPPRPANWRQISRANASNLTQRRSASSSWTSSHERPCKIQRTDNGGTPSEEPVPSFISTPSVDTFSEVLDPSDQEYPANHHYQRAASVVVEIFKDPDFDPAEYLSVTNSQASGHSSQSLAELEAEDSRVVVLSQFSQKTVPDSQEISDQSWSHHRVAERQPSPVAPAKNISQPSPDSCVIADSLEQPQTTASRPSTAATNSQPSSPLSCPSPPGQTRKDISQESEAVESDIPSHQPDHSSASVDAGAPELSESVSHEPSESAVSPRSISQQSGTRQAFLSQSSLPVVFNVPESSVDSQVTESPCRTVDEATPANNEQTGTILDQRESQAAQIVRQTFGSADQQLTDSDPKQVIPDSQSYRSGQANISKEPSPTAVPSQQSAVSSARSQPSVQEDLPDHQQSASEVASSPEPTDHSSPRTMEELVPGKDDWREYPEIMADLSEIFSLDTPGTKSAPPSSDGRGQPSSSKSHAYDLTPGDELMDAKLSERRKSHTEQVAEELEAIFNPQRRLSLPPRPQLPEPQPVTVSLADITQQAEPVLEPSTASQDPLSSKLYESSIDPIQMGQDQSKHDSIESSPIPPQESSLMEHIITLPFQASLRPLYDDILMEYRGEIKDFGRIFSNEEYLEPEESLVERIDELFSRLFNLCDYPRDIVGSVLEELTSLEQTMYCYDANPKFNFLFELLQGVQQGTDILIIARSPSLLRLLCHLAEALKLQFTCDAIGRSNNLSGGSDARVVLALPTDQVDPSEFDAVIGFDHSFSNSPIAQRLSSMSSNNRQQLVLVLVTTHSIEHIDLQLPHDLDPVERRSARLSAIVRSRKLVTDPDRGYPEPHKIAAIFFDFLNGQVDEASWEPVPIPDDVLDLYAYSQTRSQMSMDLPQEQENGRKRKQDDSDGSDAKRMRVLSTKEATVDADKPPLPHEVSALLEAATPKEGPSSGPEVQVQVPLSVLQALAEKVSEYERQIDAADCEDIYKGVISALEKRVKEYERTTRKVYKSQRAALQDRSQFEAEKLKVEASMQAASEQAEKEAEKARKRIAELESAVARLTEDPNAPLAKREELWRAAQTKVGVLEKRLENAHKDVEYVRNLYQDASTSASAMKTENNQLKAQNESLRKKAAGSFARVHQIQEQSTVKAYLSQITGLKLQVRERETELDRARDELRQLKNGRRETQQVSAPRSPRMGMMSPRTIRGCGGPASRGTSPAPGTGMDGTQFLGQQPGNGRWNHLRD